MHYTVMQIPALDRQPVTPVVRAAFRRTQWVWEHEVGAFFQRLQDPALHWRPGPGRTIAQILIHIGSVVWYYQDALHAGLGARVPAPTWGEPYGEEWRAYYDEAFYVHHGRPWYEEFLTRSYASYMGVLSAVNDGDLDVVCATRDDKRRTVEWILQQVPGHTDYHIGQVNYIHGRYEETLAARA